MKAKPIPATIGNKFTVCEHCESGLWDKAKGKPAGVLNKDGYWHVCYESKRYPAHRIVWFLVNNKDPGELEVDHIDRDKSNNKISNLRAITSAKNKANRNLNKLREKSKKDPFKIYKRKRAKGYKYQVVRYIDRRQIYLGTFDTFEEANNYQNSLKRADHN